MAYFTHVDMNAGTYGVMGTNDDYHVKGRLPKMEQIVRDRSTGGTPYYELLVDDLGEEKTLTISKEAATDGNRLMEYAPKGLSVTSATRNTLAEAMLQLEEVYLVNDGEIGYVHSYPGVYEVEMPDGSTRKAFCGKTNPLTGEKYVGDLDLESEDGSAAEWAGFFNEEMRENFLMQFLLGIGFAAILLQFLANVKEIPVEGFCVELVGETSLGKSTMTRAIISILGCSDPKADGTLMHSFSGTRNFIEDLALSAPLIGLDEASSYKGGDPGTLIYNLGNGQGKGRMSRSGFRLPVKTSVGIIVTNGEVDLLEKTQQNGGQKVRFLIVTPPDEGGYTADAAQSDRIVSFCKRCYGHPAAAFGSYLSDVIHEKGIGEIKQRFEENRQAYLAKTSLTDTAERQSMKMALILTSCEYANEGLGMEFDVDAILNEAIIQNETRSGSNLDDYWNLYTEMVSVIFSNLHRFIHPLPKQPMMPVEYVPDKAECWGKISELKKEAEIEGRTAGKEAAIRVPFFRKIMIEILKKEQYRNFLRWTKKVGLLNHEKDRYTRSRKIDGSTEDVYVFYIAERVSADESDLKEQPKKVPLSMDHAKCVTLHKEAGKEKPRILTEDDD